jgi:hypothetical protein
MNPPREIARLSDTDTDRGVCENALEPESSEVERIERNVVSPCGEVGTVPVV